MNGEFEIGKLAEYTVQFVEPNDFLNQKLTNDMYGTWFSVKFTGDAATHLWQAKNAPQPGEKVWGRIELTSSGKSTKFKRAKKEEIPQSTSTHSVPHDSSQQESIARSVALKAAVDYCNYPDTPVYTTEGVLKAADMFLAWLTNSGSGGESVSQSTSALTNEEKSPSPAADSTPKSGYDRFKQTGEAIRTKTQQERDEDAEMRSLMESGYYEDNDPS